MILLCASYALANGITTHLWVSEQALLLLPEGELKSLLSSEEGHLGLVNGTVFPDGGYAVGHAYGEAGHWEPLQSAYRSWLVDELGSPPYDTSEADFVGFFFGMSSHGMADQVFDSMFMERSKVYEGVLDPSLDESSDILLVSQGGGHDTFDAFIPYEALIPLYAEQGIEVDEDTLDDGHSFARLEPFVVGTIGADPDAVAEYAALYPWTNEHLLDATVFGSPPLEAQVVAAYWQELYRRMMEDIPTEVPYLDTFPRDGAFGHPRGLNDVESRITIVFPRGLEANLLGPQAFRLREGEPEEAGRELPFSVDLFYGQSSHVVLLTPGEELAEDQRYTVEVVAGEVFDREGGTFPVGGAFSFSTGAAPKTAAGGEPPQGCGCRSSGLPQGMLPALLIAWTLSGRRRRQVSAPLAGRLASAASLRAC